jgi:hypothetical protein
MHFRSVVSHPFARKKAKGWGTGLLWIGKIRKRNRKSYWPSAALDQSAAFTIGTCNVDSWPGPE